MMIISAAVFLSAFRQSRLPVATSTSNSKQERSWWSINEWLSCGEGRNCFPLYTARSPGDTEFETPGETRSTLFSVWEGETSTFPPSAAIPRLQGLGAFAFSETKSGFILQPVNREHIQGAWASHTAGNNPRRLRSRLALELGPQHLEIGLRRTHAHWYGCDSRLFTPELVAWRPKMIRLYP